MEMKADIAGNPMDKQFHKIYIQRHENVRYVISWCSQNVFICEGEARVTFVY